jgi:hypothetical protein
MKLLIVFIILAFVLCAPLTLLHAQGETAVPFLLIPSSPEGNGMGGIIGTTPTENPMAATANPGQLGLMSLNNIASIGFYPVSTTWLPGYTNSDFTYSVIAVNAGIRLNQWKPLPFGLSIGIGYAHISNGLGNINVSYYGSSGISSYTAEEHSNNFTLGIGIEQSIRIGFGLTYKRINSNLLPEGIYTNGNASTFAFDLGLIMDAPVTEIIKEKTGAPLFTFSKTEPIVDIALSSAWNNMGDHFVNYLDPGQGDPLPRYAMIGMSCKAGLVLPIGSAKWEVISLTLARQVEDVLVERFAEVVDSNGNVVAYAPRPRCNSGLGSIQFFNNLLLGEGNSHVTLRKGWQLNLGEFVSLRGGSVHGKTDSYSTDGWGLQLRGLLKLLDEVSPEFSDSPLPMFVLNHVDLRYDHASSAYDDPENPNDGVTYNSISVVVK